MDEAAQAALVLMSLRQINTMRLPKELLILIEKKEKGFILFTQNFLYSKCLIFYLKK